MNRLQLGALVKRIRLIVNTFRDALDKGEMILLEDDQWNEDTLKDQLSGKYGNTLLFQYNSHINNMIFDMPGYFRCNGLKAVMAMLGFVKYDFSFYSEQH